MINLRKKISELKKRKGAVILAHSYQLPEIQDLADSIGDSLELSRKAATLEEDLIVFCGVEFMAESAKILSPQKTVLLPRREADCFLAEMIDIEGLRRLKTKHPEAKVVCYVNTSADIKAESDVCCTSANAVKVVSNIDAEKIIFVPDRNLAHYVSRHTDKKIIPWDGYCYIHQRMRTHELEATKLAHPDAKVLVHPECRPEVVEMADEVLSTSGILRFCKESNNRSFIIGTEEGLIHRARLENPDKMFYPLGTPRMCVGMKVTRLTDLYDSLNEEKYPIEVPEDIAVKARASLDQMLEYI